MGIAAGRVMQMPTSDDILDELYSIQKIGYGKELPGPHDLRFIELTEQYANSNVAERERIRNIVDPDYRLLLLGFGDRLAILADRTNDSRMVLLALLAHSIEDFRYDERENIFRLALINHVAKKLGETPSKFFDKAIRLSSPKARKKFREFDDRPEELKSLQTMQALTIATSNKKIW